MMTRRSLICAALCASTPLIRAAFADDSLTQWQQWQRFYVSSGRVIDAQQGGISHSEGQGYGLLLAQAHGDRQAFDEIDAWTRQHIAIRDDRLMAWKWQPGPGNNIADWHNATDGDLFRAWALLRAGRDSGWAGCAENAVQIARDIANLCMAPDPRAESEHLLLPGAEARRFADRVLINPSYFMSRALRELGVAAGEPRLIKAADHGETVLTELASMEFLPNWIDVTPDGFASPMEHDLRWGYDALRIPLYLVWSGHSDHEAVRVADKYMNLGTTRDHVVVEATPQGAVLVESDRAGFQAVRDLTNGDLSILRALTGEDYYSDTLLMMARLARRESQGISPLR